ncbi:MAG: HAMP domain-containing protein [Anaerolineae bacterium]|nr:HAMP domain-containing protein [Anaerolineae bacterium]MBL8106324.1 HAMP domain-containing protein [Anaerolineales bacterium]MCC7187771.1 HAMP domain-containing protein [Anaerolineales bacterium]
MKKFFSRAPFVFQLILGAAVIVAITLGIFTLVMFPPMQDIANLALYLSLTALVSAVIGYLAYSLGWIHMSPTLRWTLLGGYILASVLTFFNVWFSAQMMFSSQHDLLLAIVLLVFAGGMATVLGYFLSGTITQRIHLLKNAAENIAHGELNTRVPVQGHDEVAGLAKTFNQMAEQLQESDSKQRELEHMRRDLIAWVGHDLQTPLTSVRAILEALSDGVVEDPETASRYLRTAQRDVNSLSALIDDLFQMAQLDTGGFPLDRQNASLSDLVSDTLESFTEPAKQREIKLEGNVEYNVDPVNMDTQAIGRALNNLIGNALRHTPDQGRVSVWAHRTGKGIEVTVSDTGEGIREEDLPHVFESFYRGDAARSRSRGTGAGLGLAIARGIVQAHGGEIRVESKPGKGTLFTFTIP